jgi:hypothetical protein
MTWDPHLQDNLTTGPEDIKDAYKATKPEIKKKQEEPHGE